MKRSVAELFNWKDNPRAIKQDKFEELKYRIKRLGQIKPLIVTDEGEVLGGNMRLRAFKELGIKEAWVSVVHPKSEAEKIEIALTDNEEMGYYEDQALAELIEKYKEDIDLTKYSVHLTEPETLQEILNKYGIDGYGDEFSLPDGDKPGFQQITFTLADEQAELIKDCIANAKSINLETYDNENSNGNAIYWICKQWQQSKI
jgi:hypothetical protein